MRITNASVHVCRVRLSARPRRQFVGGVFSVSLSCMLLLSTLEVCVCLCVPFEAPNPKLVLDYRTRGGGGVVHVMEPPLSHVARSGGCDD